MKALQEVQPPPFVHIYASKQPPSLVPRLSRG